ncbi:unnamed protein product [Pipistrellus nathusii]|uniref:Uncharacterized protein n=1 Tax=Pipistrellus nathusii TaxID=59473 RepID=A0ABN9ZDH2_PIPNA
MVVCCHLPQGTPTGTVVHVTSCFKSRYPGQILGWPASPTIILFKFNEIKIPKTHLPFSAMVRARGISMCPENEGWTQPLLLPAGGGGREPTEGDSSQRLPGSSEQRRERGGDHSSTHTAGMWGPRQHTHQQACGDHGSTHTAGTGKGSDSLTVEHALCYLSKTCRTMSPPVHEYWKPKVFKRP